MLSPLDWLSLFDTCKTLRNVTKRTFPLVFEEIDLSELLMAYVKAHGLHSVYNCNNETSVALVTNFLRAFGNMINRLELTLHPTAEKIAREYLDAIVLYCSGTLKSLK